VLLLVVVGPDILLLIVVVVEVVHFVIKTILQLCRAIVIPLLLVLLEAVGAVVVQVTSTVQAL